MLSTYTSSNERSHPHILPLRVYTLVSVSFSRTPTAKAYAEQVLDAYAKGLGEKRWKPIEIKLKEGKLISLVSIYVRETKLMR